MAINDCSNHKRISVDWVFKKRPLAEKLRTWSGSILLQSKGEISLLKEMGE